MLRLASCLPALCFSVGAFASTVIYTDSTHPVSSPPDIPVVYLDAPERLQIDIFGSLSTDPVQAENQARGVIASAEFKERQQQWVTAYQGVMKAWSLGLDKYPAVVFDDQFVVYGTTDVDTALQQIGRWKEARR